MVEAPMLYIEFQSEKECHIHVGDDLSKLPVEPVTEMIVDGDEVGALFGMGDTHGARDITLKGAGVQTLLLKLKERGKL